MMRGLSLLAGLVLLTSCELIVEVDVPDTEPALVLNSFVEPGKPWIADLTPFLPATSGLEVGETLIQDGQIEIYQNGERLTTLTFREADTGDVFFSPVLVPTDYYLAEQPVAEAGATYEIRASAPGFPEIRAETTVPHPVTLDTLRTRFISTPESFRAGISRLDLALSDVAGDSYYFLALQIPLGLDDLVVKRLFTITDAPFISASPLEEAEVDGLFFSDATFQDQTVTFSIEADVDFGEVISVVLYTVTESYYRYHTTRQDQVDERNNPFAEPAPVYNNVENGYGIFGGLAAAPPIRLNPTALRPAELAGTYRSANFFVLEDVTVVPILNAPEDATLTLDANGNASATLRILPDRHPDLPNGFEGTLDGQYTIDATSNLVELSFTTVPILDGLYRFSFCNNQNRREACGFLNLQQRADAFPRYDISFISGSF